MDNGFNKFCIATNENGDGILVLVSSVNSGEDFSSDKITAPICFKDKLPPSWVSVQNTWMRVESCVPLKVGSGYKLNVRDVSNYKYQGRLCKEDMSVSNSCIVVFSKPDNKYISPNLIDSDVVILEVGVVRTLKVNDTPYWIANVEYDRDIDHTFVILDGNVIY